MVITSFATNNGIGPEKAQNEQKMHTPTLSPEAAAAAAAAGWTMTLFGCFGSTNARSKHEEEIAPFYGFVAAYPYALVILSDPTKFDDDFKEVLPLAICRVSVFVWWHQAILRIWGGSDGAPKGLTCSVYLEPHLRENVEVFQRALEQQYSSNL